MKLSRALAVAGATGMLAVGIYFQVIRNALPSSDPWVGQYTSLSSMQPIEIRITRHRGKYLLTGARDGGEPWGQSVTGSFDPINLKMDGEFHFKPSGVSKFTGAWNAAKERFELIDDQGDARIGFYLVRDDGQYALAHPMPKCLSDMRPMPLTEAQTEYVGDVWGIYSAHEDGALVLAKLEKELGEATKILPDREAYTWIAKSRTEYDSFPLNFELLVDQRPVVERGKVQFVPAKGWITFIDYKLGGETQRRDP